MLRRPHKRAASACASLLGLIHVDESQQIAQRHTDHTSGCKCLRRHSPERQKHNKEQHRMTAKAVPGASANADMCSSSVEATPSQWRERVAAKVCTLPHFGRLQRTMDTTSAL